MINNLEIDQNNEKLSFENWNKENETQLKSLQKIVLPYQHSFDLQRFINLKEIQVLGEFENHYHHPDEVITLPSQLEKIQIKNNILISNISSLNQDLLKEISLIQMLSFYWTN